MFKFSRRVYTVRGAAVPHCFLITVFLLSAGCGGAITTRQKQARSTEILAAINQAREAEGLDPVQMDDVLNRTASERAGKLAAAGKVSSEENRLPALIEAGSFARFALSHEAKRDSLDDAAQALIKDPLAKSKYLHGNLTHIGIGFAEGSAGVFATMDLARLVTTHEVAEAREKVLELVAKKRANNSVSNLEIESNLDERAGEVAQKYMDGAGTSDALIAEAQAAMGGAGLSLGRVIISFQVAGDADAIVIPSRTSDPSLAYIGVGLAQGNNADHEPGSLAVVLFLAQPQTAHDARREISNLPPPKQAPKGGLKSTGSLAEQAWIATLAGNHKKAADLFRKAYAVNKEPGMLYEAARAFARDEDTKDALALMQQYAEIAEGDKKKQALDMAAKLEKGETIFSKSEEKQMSVEAQRFFVMGQRLFEAGEWDGAIDAFQQAYTYSKHIDIVYNIGLTHIRAGRVGEALEFFEEYQKNVPEARNVDEAKQFFDIGVELYRAGQFEAASHRFALAYSYSPFPELVYNLGLCYKVMGEKDLARRFLNEFLDTDPSPGERAGIEKMLADLNAPEAKPEKAEKKVEKKAEKKPDKKKVEKKDKKKVEKKDKKKSKKPEKKSHKKSEKKSD